MRGDELQGVSRRHSSSRPERRAELVIREKKNFETCRSWRRRKTGWKAFAQATKVDGIDWEC